VKTEHTSNYVMKIIKAVRFDQQGEVYTLEQGTHD